MKLFILSMLLLIVQPGMQSAISHSIEKNGKAIKIVDGDTFDLLTKEQKVLRIRMNGIDCPERRQDFYQSARNALSNYIFNKEVILITHGRDRNKRIIATVFCNGENINLAMIRDGYAWHYKKYSTDTSFARAEKQARLNKKGLWSSSNPVAPWQFRKKRPGMSTGPYTR
jgi:endonuclease YncB( thermonuclease family)